MQKNKEERSKQLHASARLGDLTHVLELLHDHKMELDINWTNYDGDTALLSAVGFSKSEVAYLLIQAGADLNISNRHGSSPLLEAAAARNEILFKHLLESGAYINVKTKSGTTPLLLAVKNFSSSVVKICLEKDANVNDQNKFGHTPLIQAILEGKYGILDKVIMLTDAGAAVNIQQRDGNTAIMLAALKNQPTVINHLLDITPTVDINLANNNGTTLLAIAAKQYDCELVTRILNLDANVHYADIAGYTPLLRAALSGNEDVISILISRGANPNAQSKTGWTALMHATDLRNLASIQLLAVRSNVNIRNDDGKSALFFATYCPKLMTLLIEEGADVNIRDKYSRTVADSIASNHTLNPRVKAAIMNILNSHLQIVKNGKWRRRKQFVLMWHMINTRPADHQYNEKMCQLLDVFDMVYRIAAYL